MEFITAGILANKLGHHSFTVAIFLSFRTDITILFFAVIMLFVVVPFLLGYLASGENKRKSKAEIVAPSDTITPNPQKRGRFKASDSFHRLRRAYEDDPDAVSGFIYLLLLLVNAALWLSLDLPHEAPIENFCLGLIGYIVLAIMSNVYLAARLKRGFRAGVELLIFVLLLVSESLLLSFAILYLHKWHAGFGFIIILTIASIGYAGTTRVKQGAKTPEQGLTRCGQYIETVWFMFLSQSLAVLFIFFLVSHDLAIDAASPGFVTVALIIGLSLTLPIAGLCTGLHSGNIMQLLFFCLAFVIVLFCIALSNDAPQQLLINEYNGSRNGPAQFYLDGGKQPVQCDSKTIYSWFNRTEQYFACHASYMAADKKKKTSLFYGKINPANKTELSHMLLTKHSSSTAIGHIVVCAPSVNGMPDKHNPTKYVDCVIKYHLVLLPR